MKDTMIKLLSVLVIGAILSLLVSILDLNPGSLQPVIFNVTETSCDFTGVIDYLENQTNHLEKQYNNIDYNLYDIQDSLDRLNPKLIEFYPRTQRSCKRPIEFNIYGYSMQPFLYDGDKIYVEKVKFKDIELGDVIVYKNKDNIDKSTIHAVIAIYDGFVVTAGYNNRWDDGIINASQIMYRYCSND